MRSLIGSMKKRNGDKAPKKERPLSVAATARQALAAGTISGAVAAGGDMPVDAHAPVVRDFAVSASHQAQENPNPGPRRADPIPNNPYAPTRPAMETFKDPDAFTKECRRRAQEVLLRVAAGTAASQSPVIKPSTVPNKKTEGQADRRLSGLDFLGK